MRYIKFNAAFLVLIIGICSSSMTAQTTKPKAKPLATPPPVLTGAEIISRADDYIETPSEKSVEKTPAKQTTATNATRINELTERIKKLESGSGSTYDDKQKRLLLNLDILTRAEQRTESLRKQLFEMIEKENVLKGRLDQIELDIRPEAIERSLQLVGSMRPEEVRDNRRKSLAAERTNVQALLTQVQTTRASIDLNLQRAEQMVERLRLKMEKDIDNALKEDEPEN